ncbi:Carcinoembryonic antigen-related cell adhesion molecule 21 [Myotis brandtii]|uniref:Carcinoembryonic antigen-related cell adhesion molecule 21 n=1 Tax=Myotis brandtii TaxID=109478 RepID=S7P8B9_MYOBR|nr:Carcinoembryonic antigen-related cell adhesion molecule 21 [Myotis brandtii]
MLLWNQITLIPIRVRAEIFEEGVWPQVSSPHLIILILYFFTEQVSVPTLLASNTTVTENEDAVVMTCYTDATSTNWLFSAMSLQLRERMKLSQDHRTLTIDPVRREDAGNYQCKVSNPVSSTESEPVELDVKH